MALEIGDEGSIFPHNRDYSEGIRERGIREGQATVVVALDGSGDAESVQEGINMLPAGGGVVYIKEGSYNLVSNINVSKNNVMIIGSGKSTIIRSSTLSGSFLLNVGAVSGIIIKNIFFNQTGVDIGGISFNGTTKSFIGECWFENGTECDIVLYNSADGNIIIQNRSTSSWGFDIINSDYNNILGNVITSFGNRGIRILNGSNNNVVSGNICISGTGTGIIIQAATGVTDRNIVSNNNCNNNSVRGIWVTDANCNNNFVHGNMAYGNTTAQITDSGTSTTLADNVTA